MKSATSAPIFTDRERATLLAALRLWQSRNLPADRLPPDEREMIEEIAREHGPSLDTEEIDALCGKLGAPQYVWVLSISHRHGSGVSVHATEEGANEALFDWVKDYWSQEIGKSEAMPADRQEAIERYFELVEDELAEIEQAEVEGIGS